VKCVSEDQLERRSGIGKSTPPHSWEKLTNGRKKERARGQTYIGDEGRRFPLPLLSSKKRGVKKDRSEKEGRVHHQESVISWATHTSTGTFGEQTIAKVSRKRGN